MKKFILIFFTLVVLSEAFINEVVAQNLKYCSTVEATEKIKQGDPKLYEKIQQDAAELDNFTKAYTTQKSNERGSIYVIPIVFHIIHNYGVENISDAQVYDALRILNEDFRKLNSDTADIVPAFKSIAADCEIEFRLAQKDPQENCTNGIVRKASLETYNGHNYWGDMSTSNVSKWPRNKYLNIWVVNSITDENGPTGAAGYTYKPPVLDFLSDLDGIMIIHEYLGSIGTGSPHRSRALTHEVGHWINLSHTWGNSNSPSLDGTVTSSNPNGIDNCDDDDDVMDTPNTRGWTSCNLNGNTCGNLDNVQNYMDYSYCTKMFTQGQGDRMKAALNSFIAERDNLWTAGNLNATGTNGTEILCKAEFEVNRTVVCAGESIDFNE